MNNEEVNKAIELEIQNLRNEADILERLLNKLKGQNGISANQNVIPSIPINAYADYFRAKTIKEAAVAILKGTGRFIHKTEYIDIIKTIDPQVTVAEMEQLVHALYTLKSDGKITNVKVDDKSQLTFWGALSWMDDGGIKPEHTFSEEVLDRLEGGKMTI